MRRTVWCFWRPTPTIRIRWNHSTSRPILTCGGTVWCDMRVLNFSSTVPCVPQAPRGPGTVHPTRRFPSFTSARLSPSILLQTASCSRLDCPCSMALPATRACPVSSTSALSQTCPPHSLLHLQQQSPHNSKQSQGQSASWKLLCRHAAGQGEQQQALRGEHLDVALRQGLPPDGVHRRG